MLYSALMLALAASANAAVYQGFNYGSSNTDGSAKTQTDFENEFSTAQQLVGTSGFTSARIYTMIQGGTAADPIDAIPAAIKTKTTLLLGMWASGGETVFSNELAALATAINKYGSSFTDLVVGLSVGSEDLYRNSVMGVQANAGVGVDPSVIVDYISQAKKAVASTALDNVPIGHVDTWTAYVNGSNDAVISACDFIGMDAYPYFQNTMANDISAAADLFNEAYANTTNAAGGKPVWVTETGWPVSGKTENLGVPSISNAKSYWDQVACKLLGKTNTWWYTLQDASPTTPNPSFGLVGSTLTTKPLYDLSCDSVSSSSSSSSSAASSTKSSGSKTATGSSESLNTSMATLSSATGSVTASVTGAPVVPSSVSSAASSGSHGSVSGAAASSAATGSSASGTSAANPAQATGAASSSRPVTIAAIIIGVVAAGVIAF